MGHPQPLFDEKPDNCLNPYFMLDEVDKIGNDRRGDPSRDLLKVLDPAKIRTFLDHCLDVDFDLSDVIFITSANQQETIPHPVIEGGSQGKK